MSQKDKRPLYIPHAGPSLLEMPLLNKGSAFSLQERIEFNLVGLLPNNVESISEQVRRAYHQYQQCRTDLERHIYLRAIQDDNETLFFRLIEQHIEEMLPIIYTPTVGAACEEFSNIYRNHRGLFVSYPDRKHMDDILRSATKENVKVIVVTDGERILGLGDQGIGGMGIPIGKLSLYTACGGISPAYTLPVTLDVGTNNRTLLNDPMYMGWRNERISQDEYDAFIEEFVAAVKRRWPKVLVQFEDFAQTNAMPLLNRYRDKICCFNDDIQGTASVALGTMLAACKAKDEKLSKQKVLVVGAGSAGCGIAEQVVSAMVNDGLSEAEARARIFMFDRYGLVTSDMKGLHDFQEKLAQDPEKYPQAPEWDLENLIAKVKPTMLIGVSGQGGLFTQPVIEALHKGCKRPLVMPLSNPTSRAEATPEEVLTWTGGDAMVATGSPFEPVELDGNKYPIAQCNNVYIFPGIGLGVIAAGANRVTENMLMAASNALAENAPVVKEGSGALLPSLSNIREVGKAIARAVGKQAQEDGVAPGITEEKLEKNIEKNFWSPNYRRYRRRAF
ncbi:NAD-dependent malic enzyme [Microbulbifer hydrolyticus]|uniref:malate dehydrogenase (oxaloacetate-decarboxylating) n=1 Tax=Microbulbifer hydrolyticus TaxID=48074 RepID=A0A6P1T820_9GAMM|nr:NAD-dependent malic enzyme [Microbulbifer hydrolyticus]MBB5211597.1 malate dehydrogenase (oxaloacetate-decarboxylating) [Microbulbifer hydrolyticus]QHQ37666.1 oxaloacetate-decarboxylating malate dehydrogenase [Microbulbifer hydrolyticus]